MRKALAKLDDPVERLTEFIRLTINVEPTPLNLALAKQETTLLLSHPAEVVRAQAPMAALGRDLVRDAVAAGRIEPGHRRARGLFDDGAEAVLQPGPSAR